MSGIRLQNIDMLYALWLLPLLAGAYVYASVRRRQALEAFIEAGLLEQIKITVSATRRRWKAILVSVAFGFGIIALARPGWNPKPKRIERHGRDVVFLLDVSKSMLAEDLVPNRLERAKLAIRDCVDRLEGDRVGLVAFAGTASVKCPLTLDYGFFRMILDTITTDSITRGGTMIGDAVRRVLDEVFDDQFKKYKDIVLITDGEDHDSFPVQAAEQAGEKGVRIIAIGLGDESEGKRIPVTDERGRRSFLQHDGEEVWSRLDADTLRKMVNASANGKYLNVSTGTIDLGAVYTRLIASAEKREVESKMVKRYEEKFQIFLTVTFVLLCMELVVSERQRRRSVDA